MKLIELKKIEDEKIDYIGRSCIGLVVCKLHKGRATHTFCYSCTIEGGIATGVFPLNPETGLYIDASEGDKKILKDYLAASFMKLKPVAAEEGHTIVLKQVAQLPEVNSSEGYVLTVTPDQVLIRATSGAGLFYGVQTMLQMADEKGLPVGVITDEPRLLIVAL